MGISHGGPYDGPDKERLLLRDRLGDIVKFHMHKESNRRLDFVRVLLDTAMYMTEQQMVTDTINHPDIHYKPLTLQELGHALINEDLAAPDFIVGSLSKLWGMRRISTRRITWGKSTTMSLLRGKNCMKRRRISHEPVSKAREANQ